MIRRRKAKNRKTRRAHRWLSRRTSKTKNLVKEMTPLCPEMDAREISQFLGKLQTIAYVTHK